MCVRVGVRYVITKFARMDSLLITHGAPEKRASRARQLRYHVMFNFKFKVRIALFDLLDLGAHSLKYPLDCSKRLYVAKLNSSLVTKS